MTCPMCGLENPASADRCDCGHAFTLAGAALPRIQNHAPVAKNGMQGARATTRPRIFPTIAALAVGIWLAKVLFFSDNTGLPRSATIGSTVSVSQPAVCAPSEDALNRIMKAGAIDREEFLRATGREARRAGWGGPIFVGPPDRVKVLDKTFTKARIRLIDEKFKDLREDETECWIPIEAVTPNQDLR
jgi:hypothetical protein